MWKHRIAVVCAFAAAFVSTSSFAQSSSDPSTLPRVELSQIGYLGAFRLPDTMINGDGFTLGGRPVTYDPSRNSLFIGTRAGRIAEVSIPTPVSSTNINALPFATILQGFVDPTEGNLWQVASDGAGIDGIMAFGDRLIGTASIYYDAQNTQRVSHYSRSTDLSRASFSGMTAVWQNQMTGFVSGYMASVPAEWRQKLGGPAITGQCCIPITWRTSWGPSAFVFDPGHIGISNPVAASPLLYYPQDHPTLGHWNGAGAMYGGTTQITGVAIIAGTRSILFFGRNGTGPFCYGNGTSNQALAGTIGPDNEAFCFDPTNPAKGQHAYPYNYQIWAYDLNDLAAVRAGTRQPWDVVPYGVWPFALPTPELQVRVGGVAYDAARQIIYLSQQYADQDGYGYRPLIHALRINTAGGSAPPIESPPTAPPPAPAPTPPPPTSRASAVALTPNLAAPQPAGRTINWTAVPSGGVAPYQYKWWSYNGSAWTTAVNWSTAGTFAWTPSTANAAYKVAVWVRSAGNNEDAYEASFAMDFPISAGTTPPSALPPPAAAPSTRVSTVTLATNVASPQPAGTTIVWTATPTGGSGPHQYKWWTYSGSGWVPVTTWSASNTFAWTPATANPVYRITVWVRSSWNAADEAEASAALDFPIVAAPVPTPPPPPPPPPAPATSRVSAVSMWSNLVAPQPAGTTVTLTASPTGGVAPHQFKWWIYNGTTWAPLGSWSTSNSFGWLPTVASAEYRITVWVRSAGNTVDEAEASPASVAFPITTATAAPPTPTPPVRTASVTLVANLASPQRAGTSITWTATPSGGVAPHRYKWYVFDGVTWILVRGWSTSNTYTWRPTTAGPYYRVKVAVHSAGNNTDEEEAVAITAFSIVR